MSTNYYWRAREPNPITLPTGAMILFPLQLSDPKIHIGKRWQTGGWCFRCNVTLCKLGLDNIDRAREEDWLRACPRCGTTREFGTRLLFPHDPKVQGLPKEGIFRVFGFTWAQSGSIVRSICEAHAADKLVMDDQNRLYTGQEFLDALTLVKIHSEGLIGEHFD